MKTIKFLGILSAAVFSVSCSSSNVALQSTGDEALTLNTSDEERMASKIHDEINIYRKSTGLEPLKRHSGLTKIAKQHSNFMRDNAGKFSIEGKLITHYGIDGRRLLARKKYGIESVGENVIASSNMGRGPGLAKKMVAGWLRSPNHKHNIDSTWANSGLAVRFDDDGRVFVTQLFGSKKSMTTKLGGPIGW